MAFRAGKIDYNHKLNGYKAFNLFLINGKKIRSEPVFKDEIWEKSIQSLQNTSS